MGTFWSTQLWIVPKRRFALEGRTRGRWGVRPSTKRGAWELSLHALGAAAEASRGPYLHFTACE